MIVYCTLATIVPILSLILDTPGMYSGVMPRHESVTDEYVAELKAKFYDEAERVKTAPDWPETQKRIVTGTHPYLVAMGRVDQGWSREEIATELGIRAGFGKIPNPISVIGNRRIVEDTEQQSPE
jgi:hypothetical protein